jgi:hypothetical protein
MNTTQTLPSAAGTGPHPPAPADRLWSPGQITALILGVLCLVGSAGMFAGAAGLDAVDDHWRSGDYLTSDPTALETDGHALSIQEINLEGLHGDWLLGEARLRVTGEDAGVPVFVGIATKSDAEAYLDGVDHSVVTEISNPGTRYVVHPGGAPSTKPADAGIWVAQSNGTGRQALTWTPKKGSWAVVVMNADGTGPVHVRADVGATVPVLDKAIRPLQVGGALTALVGLGLVGALVTRRARPTRTSGGDQS